LIEINLVEILIIALGFTLSSISSLLDRHAYKLTIMRQKERRWNR